MANFKSWNYIRLRFTWPHCKPNKSNGYELPLNLLSLQSQLLFLFFNPYFIVNNLVAILVSLFFSSILLSLLSYFPIVRFSMFSQMKNMCKINRFFLHGHLRRTLSQDIIFVFFSKNIHLFYVLFFKQRDGKKYYWFSSIHGTMWRFHTRQKNLTYK